MPILNSVAPRESLKRHQRACSEKEGNVGQDYVSKKFFRNTRLQAWRKPQIFFHSGLFVWSWRHSRPSPLASRHTRVDVITATVEWIVSIYMFVFVCIFGFSAPRHSGYCSWPSTTCKDHSSLSECVTRLQTTACYLKKEFGWVIIPWHS